MTAENNGEQLPRPYPTLNQVVELTRERFNSTPTYDPTTSGSPDRGQSPEPYVAYLAAGHVLLDLRRDGFDIPVLTSRFMRQTTYQVNEIDWDIILDFTGEGMVGETRWDEFMRKIAVEIVELELLNKYLDVDLENNRRKSVPD